MTNAELVWRVLGTELEKKIGIIVKIDPDKTWPHGKWADDIHVSIITFYPDVSKCLVRLYNRAGAVKPQTFINIGVYDIINPDVIDKISDAVKVALDDRCQHNILDDNWRDPWHS